eukprot:474742_1
MVHKRFMYSLLAMEKLIETSLLDMHWLWKCCGMVIWWCCSFIWYLWLCYDSLLCCSLCLRSLLCYNKDPKLKGTCGEGGKSKETYDKGIYVEKVHGKRVYGEEAYGH